MWLLFGIITVLRVRSTHSPRFPWDKLCADLPLDIGVLQFLITCSSSRLVPCLLPLPSYSPVSALQPEWFLWNVNLTSHCPPESSKAFLSQNKRESPSGGHRRCRTWAILPPARLSDLIPSVLLSSTSGSLRLFKYTKHAPSSGPLHLNPWTDPSSLQHFLCLEHSFTSFKVLDKCHLPRPPLQRKTLSYFLLQTVTLWQLSSPTCDKCLHIAAECCLLIRLLSSPSLTCKPHASRHHMVYQLLNAQGLAQRLAHRGPSINRERVWTKDLTSTPLGGREASSKPESWPRDWEQQRAWLLSHWVYLEKDEFKLWVGDGPLSFSTALCRVGLTLFLVQPGPLPDLPTSRMPPSAMSLQPEMCPWLALSAFPLPITTLTPALLLHSAVIYSLGSLPSSCPTMPHCPSPPTSALPAPHHDFICLLDPQLQDLSSEASLPGGTHHAIESPTTNTNHPSYHWALGLNPVPLLHKTSGQGSYLTLCLTPKWYWQKQHSVLPRMRARLNRAWKKPHIYGRKESLKVYSLACTHS